MTDARCAIVSALVAILYLIGAGAAAAADPRCQLDPNPVDHPRVTSGTLDGIPYNVLLPAGYASSERRYPVLYLLHARNYGENSWLARTDLATFTGDLADERAAIVVLTTAGPDGWYMNWFDGSQQWERHHLTRLLPHIDEHFRTVPDGAHRAIGGFSVGGHGAMYYAARHPELFAAAASFSGILHLTAPDDPYRGPSIVDERDGPGDATLSDPRQPSAYTAPRPSCEGRGDALGDRVRDAWSWHSRNPTDLAPNLRGTAVYFSVGNGVACGPADATEPNLLAVGEPAAAELAASFDEALEAAQVARRFDRLPCGLHTMATAQQGLHRFWDVMIAAFGRRSPEKFSHRSMDEEFSPWGWTIRADTRRAPEFLEISEAGAAGFRLIGSGNATVVTGRLFPPRKRVRVTGAKPTTAVADDAGRLTLAIDLGAPATEPQFGSGDANRALVARRVTFALLGRRPRLVRFSPRNCRARSATLRFRDPPGPERLRSARVRVGGRPTKTLRGAELSRPFRVRRLSPRRIRISVSARTSHGRTLRAARTYRSCRKATR